MDNSPLPHLKHPRLAKDIFVHVHTLKVWLGAGNLVRLRKISSSRLSRLIRLLEVDDHSNDATTTAASSQQQQRLPPLRELSRSGGRGEGERG